MKGKRRRKNRIDKAFAWRTLEMIESPVMKVLNKSEHLVLMRLELALGDNAGTNNGQLAVTFKQYREFGVDAQAVSPSIRVLGALGLAEKTYQGSGGRTEYHDASAYRLTFRHTDYADPTDDWRRIRTLDEAKRIAAAARKAKDPAAVERGIRYAKKDSSEVEKPQIPSGKNHLGKSNIPSGKNHRSRPRGNNHPSIYIWGEDTAEQAREARPSQGAVASEPASSSTDRDDLIMARIASRLGDGAVGWSILLAIPDDIIGGVLDAERSGSLTDEILVSLRQTFQQRGAA